MPLNRTSSMPKASSSKRLRPASPSCRGGASSVLRLTQPAAQRLPNAFDLGDWMDRAASVLMPVTGPLSDFHSHGSASGA
jgi:hypothetical protein